MYNIDSVHENDQEDWSEVSPEEAAEAVECYFQDGNPALIIDEIVQDASALEILFSLCAFDTERQRPDIGVAGVMLAKRVQQLLLNQALEGNL